MDKAVKRRMVKCALRYMAGFGIDWTVYRNPKIELFGLQAEITWKHKYSGKKLVLPDIWYDKKTGDILQAGSNYGNLTL
jgi:hypothetical protein